MTRAGSIAMLAVLTLAGCHKTKLETPPVVEQPRLVWEIYTETQPPKKFAPKPQDPADIKEYVGLTPVEANIAKDLLNVASPVFKDLTRYRVVLRAHDAGGIKQLRIAAAKVYYHCYLAGKDSKIKSLDLPTSTVNFKPEGGQVPIDPFLPYDLLFNDPASKLTCPDTYLLANATYDLTGQATDFAGRTTGQHFVVTVFGKPVQPPNNP